MTPAAEKPEPVTGDLEFLALGAFDNCFAVRRKERESRDAIATYARRGEGDLLIHVGSAAPHTNAPDTLGWALDGFTEHA